MTECPFCLVNESLEGRIIRETEHAYTVTSVDPRLPEAVMIIPMRHVETPFDLNEAEFLAIRSSLFHAKAHLDRRDPDGYNIGWNVGEVAGQHIAHVHLHIIARFKDEAMANKGIRHAFKRPQRRP